MAQITIQVEDSLVELIGRGQIEQLVQDLLLQFKRKQAPEDAAADLSLIDLTNDPQWQTTRHLDWEEYKHNFEKAV